MLFICDPTVYPPKIAETPELYQAASNDDRIELLHADPTWMKGLSQRENASVQDDGPASLATVAVDASISYEEFVDLSLLPPRQTPLDHIDVVFCRTLKPFPDGYMDQLIALEKWVPFINSPQGIGEHLRPTFLPEIADGLTAEMIVTRDVSDAVDFLDRHQTIVAKRANSCGGKGVYRVRRLADASVSTNNVREGSIAFPNAKTVFQKIFKSSQDEFQLVRYLNNVDRGDKRVLVIDGQILGAYLRRSADGGWVHNVSSGGTYHPAELSDHEREAIRKTWPHYARRGVHTLGYDFLAGDDHQWVISEINAGNIAGYSLLQELTGRPIYQDVLDWLVDFARQKRKERSLGNQQLGVFEEATLACL